MRLIDRLLEAFKSNAFLMYPSDFQNVCREEILKFISDHKINLRKDHFLLLENYGKSSFLSSDFGEISFECFKEYYLEDDPLEKRLAIEQITPEGSTYIGVGYGDVDLAINNLTGEIGFFDSKFPQKNCVEYLNIKSLLFYYFIIARFRYNLFSSEYEKHLNEIEVSKFCSENKTYKIDDLYANKNLFYFREKKLISLSENGIYTEYSGGVLKELE